MSYFNGPRIVTDGLTMCLDAANPKSIQPPQTLPQAYSVLFSGTQYLGVPSGLPAGSGSAFTLECWVYVTSLASVSTISRGGPSGGGTYLDLQIKANGSLVLDQAAVVNIFTSATGVITAQKWYHIALTRTAANLYTGYVNGVSVGSGTNNVTMVASTTIAYNAFTSTDYFKGYISDFRVVNSLVYTGAFTPPISQLTAIDNTQLLTCQASTIVDSGPNNYNISNSGSATVTTVGPYSASILDTLLDDLSGNNNTGSLVRGNSNSISSGPAFTGSSYGGISMSPKYHVEFNGTNQYLNFPTSSVLAAGTGNFTYECWMYPTSIASVRSMVSSIVQLASPGDHGINIQMETTGKITGRIYQDSTTFLILTTSASYTLNAWHHVAFTRVGSNVGLFVDGTRTNSGTSTINSTENTIIIGRQYVLNGTTFPNYFSGSISNARVTIGGTQPYDPTLTSLVVPTAPLSVSSNTALLTCHANSIRDGSNNNFPMTVSGSAIATGSFDYIACPVSLLDNYSAGTIMLWVNLNSTSGSVITSRQRDGVGTYAVFSVGSYASSGGLWATGTPGTLYWHGSNGVIQAASTGKITSNQNYHIAVTFNATQAKFYINGALDSTVAGNYSAGSQSILTLNATMIGSWKVAAGVSGSFDGTLSNMHVYNRVLSDVEVTQNYDATKGRFGL
jgi:hypothetical protein